MFFGRITLALTRGAQTPPRRRVQRMLDGIVGEALDVQQDGVVALDALNRAPSLKGDGRRNSPPRRYFPFLCSAPPADMDRAGACDRRHRS